MDADDVKRYICTAFDGIDAIDNNGDTFLIYDPARDLPPVRDLLAEAHAFAARKYANQQPRHRAVDAN